MLTTPSGQRIMHDNEISKFDELKKLRTPIRNANFAYKESLTRLEQSALWITGHVGKIGFFFIIVAWTALWLLWNTLAPAEVRFDPFPAFVLWLFISNTVQIFLMPLIMIGQNLQGRHAQARAQADFEVNVKAEREIEAILEFLEAQNKIIVDLHKRLKTKD